MTRLEVVSRLPEWTAKWLHARRLPTRAEALSSLGFQEMGQVATLHPWQDAGVSVARRHIVRVTLPPGGAPGPSTPGVYYAPTTALNAIPVARDIRRVRLWNEKHYGVVGGADISENSGFSIQNDGGTKGTGSDGSDASGQAATYTTGNLAVDEDNEAHATNVRINAQPRFLPYLAVKLRMGGAIANQRFWCILSDDPATQLGADDPATNWLGIRFHSALNGGRFSIGRNDAAGAGTFADSGITVVASTFYLLEVIFTAASTAIVRINGTAFSVSGADMPTTTAAMTYLYGFRTTVQQAGEITFYGHRLEHD